MDGKNRQADNKFMVVTLVAGIFLIALLVGNAIGIAVSRANIANIRDFYYAMGGWEAIARLSISLVLIIYSIRKIKKLKE